MRKLVFVVMFVASIYSNLSAQVATDVTCQQSKIYGSIGTGVHELDFNLASGIVTDLGAVAPSSVYSLSNVAYAYDITQGSTNRTFYSSTNVGGGRSTILRWTGAVWDSITTDTILYYNSAGYGPFIYFQRTGAGGINDLCISRLNANGTLTQIFNDSSLVFSVADMAVDHNGNIYCFRGTSIGNTTELTVLDSTGAIVNSFSTTLNHLSVFFGMVIVNDTLYLGQGTTNSQMFPVLISGSTATLGAPMSMNFPMNDLASCHQTEGEVNGLSENALPVWANFNFNHSSRILTIDNLTNAEVTSVVYDLSGKVVYSGSHHNGKSEILAQMWKSGIYQLVLMASGGQKMVNRLVIP